MAGETIYSGLQPLAAALAPEIAEYFYQMAIAPGIARTVNFGPNSSSLQINIQGGASAAVVSEATEASNAVYARTKVTLTAVKAVSLAEVTDESVKFGGGSIISEVSSTIGRALVDKVDTDAMALATGFSQSQGTTATALAIEDIEGAALLIKTSKIPGPYIAVLSPKQAQQLRAEIREASAPVWGNESLITLFGGTSPRANGFEGTVSGIDIYSSTNISDDATDYAGMVIAPREAIVLALAGTVEIETERNASKSTTEVIGRLFYDVKEFRDLAGVELISGV